ncbi:hypothetical protein Moror_16833 [Moniliophthora roreri MCA 2997]|uniref:Oxidoreductase AflY n=1 Tax=Moniliophthora roreri (strain MCA 2997) TaxID=1381753 RepID=V2XAE7_MONRO|nr:hypothetical protein Moror_16833 [Moniliophthora roreri MCA 2997]
MTEISMSLNITFSDTLRASEAFTSMIQLEATSFGDIRASVGWTPGVCNGTAIRNPINDDLFDGDGDLGPQRAGTVRYPKTMSHSYSSTTFDLWPTPSRPPSLTSPGRLPGSSSHESVQILRQVLKDNHEKWHIFFDDFPRHNHITHHLLAIWAMGADGDIIRRVYDHDIQIQRPIGSSPEVITKENVYKHVGDARYYKAYLDFFKDAIRERDPGKVMEDYIFSYEANYGQDKPEMLARMMAGLGHGLIHLGYGAEFGLPGMFVQGLAQAAASNWPSAPIHPPSLFQGSIEKGSQPPLHAFTVISRLLADAKFVTKGENFIEMWGDALKVGDAVYELVEQWLPGASEIEKKIEELHWVAALLYAVSGYKRGEVVGRGNDDRGFNADFVSMHFATASIFLSSLMPFLTMRSQLILLRSSFGMMLLWWIALGRPELDVSAFFDEPLLDISSTVDSTVSNSVTLPNLNGITPKNNPNPWLGIIQQSLVHPDDHLPKLVRSLLHFSDLYGCTAPSTFNDTGLDGAEKIDGTLFLRAAFWTFKRLEKFEEGKEPPEFLVYGWDFKTFRDGLKGAMS